MRRTPPPASADLWRARMADVSAARERLTACVVDAGHHRSDEWARFLTSGNLQSWRCADPSLYSAALKLKGLFARENVAAYAAIETLLAALRAMPDHH